MKINVKRIPIEGESLSGVEPGSIVGVDSTDLRFDEDVRYDVLAQIQGHSLLVTGRIETVAKARCSRCLKDISLPLAVSQFVVLKELTGEDFVDLTENLREDIILELPQRVLCDENCKGLCIRCGKDLNEGACQCDRQSGDLRWHALDQINIK
jgi:uncharacterized protein